MDKTETAGLVATPVSQAVKANAKHPSGMTQERWEWPFKTPEERKLVAKYFQKLAKEDKNKELDSLGEALL